MQPWNKQNLISFAVMITAAIVLALAGIMAFLYLKAKAPVWALIVPLIAIGYAVVAFVKKYYQKSDY